MVSGAARLLSALALCSAGGVGPRAQPTPPIEAPAAQARCSVELPATQLTVTDVPPHGAHDRGVLLEYTTQANLVGRVRDLVHGYAAVQNGAKPVASGAGVETLGPTTRRAPPGTAVLVPGAHASVTDTAAGARLLLAPVAPELQRLLHAAARSQRQSASNRPCPPDVRLTPTL